MCVFPVFLLDFHQQSRFFEFFPENILWVLKKLVPLHSLSLCTRFRPIFSGRGMRKSSLSNLHNREEVVQEALTCPLSLPGD